jgi:hypothetical protein
MNNIISSKINNENQIIPTRLAIDKYFIRKGDTVNFSRINNTILYIKLIEKLNESYIIYKCININNTELHIKLIEKLNETYIIYAHNYSVLKPGMAGRLFMT